MNRRTLFALTGTGAVGLAAVAVPAVHASATAESSATAAEAADARPICDGWSDFEIRRPDDTVIIHVPTEGVGTSQTNCVRAGANGGLYKLELALNLCYGLNVKDHSTYDNAVAGAVRDMQGRIGATPDGVYGPQTKSLMSFPAFKRSQEHPFLGVCFRLADNLPPR